MEELTLKSNIQPAVLAFNSKEIQAILDTRLQEYRNLVVTEDSLPGCRNAKKELASFRNRLDEFRKEQKSEAEKPIKQFDKQIRDLISQVESVEKPLNEALDVYTEKERQKRREFAQKKFDEAAEAAGLRPEYAAKFILKKEFTNVTATLKSIREDVQAQADALKRQQDEHDKNAAIIRETIEMENERIQVKLDPAEFLEDFERGTEAVDVIRRIKRRAGSIFQQEKKMEEERIEKERLEKERVERELREAEEAAAKAAAEASRSMAEEEDAMEIPAELFAPEPEATSADGGRTGAVEETARPELTAPAPAPAPAATPEERRFRVTFCVTGGFDVLKGLNDYMKDKGISYQVIEQVKI